MKHSIINHQDLLAEQFFVNDVYTGQVSYEAVLKIKRWKLIVRIPGIGDRIRKEANSSIARTFFSFVPNTYVLLEEGYYFTSSLN